MSMRDLISGEAELDDEENDDSFDEETGEVRGRGRNGNNGNIDDSSEEEDDDDDEEAARAVCLDNRNACLACETAVLTMNIGSGRIHRRRRR